MQWPDNNAIIITDEGAQALYGRTRDTEATFSRDFPPRDSVTFLRKTTNLSLPLPWWGRGQAFKQPTSDTVWKTKFVLLFGNIETPMQQSNPSFFGCCCFYLKYLE